MRVLSFYGNGEERDKLRQQLRSSSEFDVVLTTFETVLMEKNELKRMQFEFLILDEA